MSGATERILIIGAGGQLGLELTESLRTRFGIEHVVTSDIKEPKGPLRDGPYVSLDAMNR